MGYYITTIWSNIFKSSEAESMHPKVLKNTNRAPWALTKERSKRLQSNTMHKEKANGTFKTKPANQKGWPTDLYLVWHRFCECHRKVNHTCNYIKQDNNPNASNCGFKTVWSF